jgi:hypothetical protein
MRQQVPAVPGESFRKNLPVIEQRAAENLCFQVEEFGFDLEDGLPVCLCFHTNTFIGIIFS